MNLSQHFVDFHHLQSIGALSEQRDDELIPQVNKQVKPNYNCMDNQKTHLLNFQKKSGVCWAVWEQALLCKNTLPDKKQATIFILNRNFITQYTSYSAVSYCNIPFVKLQWPDLRQYNAHASKVKSLLM